MSNVDRGTILTKSQVNNVKRLCQLRMSRMPVQYVVGEWDFHDLTLEMRQPVLIPRPETEELASLCMDTLSALLTTTERKTFLEIGPVLEQLQKLGPFCLAVSNPPYISTSEMDSLQEEVRCFEDHQALYGGKDGMDIIREVMLKTSQLLQPGGHLWLEVGVAHSSLVESFASDPKTWKDLPQQVQFLETATDLYGKLRFCHLIVSSGTS
ncbi:hemK methyltransferase family member 1 [Plakobranchus ocellatus]|uniref:HemK methyltransferase family member 1 n=1 Tax=Plakobranchus ocellatus TaxID=259542 RepID=A0AAV4CDE6_9GAST|nr:hemK methyltransferase family member 1 [Plakobranchus ocellatus]